MAITPVKMIRLGGESLELATRLVLDFKKKGYRSTYSSVVDTAVPILHAVTLGKYNLVSDAEVAERRAYDVGTSIAVILGALCSAKVDMTGCQLGYLPEVDAISIRLDAVPDILIHAGGADPAMIANIVKTQLLAGGYLQDDGTVLVDMEKLLGTPVKEGN
jgi:hypothetical protein